MWRIAALLCVAVADAKDAKQMEQMLQSTLDGISPTVASISQELSNGVAQITQMSAEMTMVPGQMFTAKMFGNKEQLADLESKMAGLKEKLCAQVTTLGEKTEKEGSKVEASLNSAISQITQHTMKDTGKSAEDTTIASYLPKFQALSGTLGAAMSGTSAISGLAGGCKTGPATAPEATRLYEASTPAIHFPSALLGAVAAVAAVGVVFGVLSMRRARLDSSALLRMEEGQVE
ncbi:unnamed protein product [Effrenium voratum]|uniref:Uncharacterized protein n=1 Tax=Effrenium voratum TaxID=2562239 RepID=A0AA36IL40_9DINO|nr:unnamed protein product [Effrenium voratum]CAJ1389347.1 unnamed protein product [Effrenium voratum]